MPWWKYSRPVAFPFPACRETAAIVPSECGLQPRRAYRTGPHRLAEFKSQLGTCSRSCELEQAGQVLDVLLRQQLYVPTDFLYQVLKTCIADDDILAGTAVHAIVLKSGYQSNRFLANHLICMYASQGRLQEAEQVFSELAAPNAHSWSSIISAHAEHGQPGHAIRLYLQMRQSKVLPDNYVFLAVLKACASIAELTFGRQVHAEVLRTGDDSNVFIGSCLVDMYAKCGSLDEARRVFDNMVKKNVVTWNAMLAGYAQHGLAQEALSLFANMQLMCSTPPDHVTFLCLLKACGSVGELHQVKEVHGQIEESGLASHLVIGNCLVDTYAKCGSLDDARWVFDHLATKDLVTWTTMLTAYARDGLGQEALELYAIMQHQGITAAGNVTFTCLLKACASTGGLDQGKQLHAEIQKHGLESDLVVGSSLVDMYAKCGSLDEARRVFDNLVTKDVVAWTAMLSGYAELGLGQEALSLYTSMQEEGVTPADKVTFACLLKTCASIGALHHGKQLHAQIQARSLDFDLVLGNCLVDMYVKCGSFDEACKVFYNLPMRDVVTWNVMFTGYAQHGRGQDALSLFATMEKEGTTPDHVTFVSLLKACASIAALHKGKQLHTQIQARGLAGDQEIGNCLVDMYAKCGSLHEACMVFDNLVKKDVVTWNAMLAGYAQHGLEKQASQCFERMGLAGISPDGVTFLSLISACAHACEVDKGVGYFKLMTRDKGLVPQIEHYVSMIDLFGSAGCFASVNDVLSTMPMQPNLATWLCVLGACRKHGNVALAERAFASAVHLAPEHAAAYILMSHMYADAGLSQNAWEVEKLRKERCAWKEPGWSWVEDEQGVHTFLVGDSKHRQHQHLHDLLVQLSLKLNMAGLMQQVGLPLLPDA